MLRLLLHLLLLLLLLLHLLLCYGIQELLVPPRQRCLGAAASQPALIL
jgi:hypothetical protein